MLYLIKLTKFYANDIELSKTITLTDGNPSIIITEKEYDFIFLNKKSLFEDGLILTDIIEEKKEIKNTNNNIVEKEFVEEELKVFKEDKKFNKK